MGCRWGVWRAQVVEVGCGLLGRGQNGRCGPRAFGPLDGDRLYRPIAAGRGRVARKIDRGEEFFLRDFPLLARLRALAFAPGEEAARLVALLQRFEPRHVCDRHRRARLAPW